MPEKQKSRHYADRIVRGSGLVFASTIVGYVASYFLRLFLTRQLTVEEYGLLYAIITFVNFFALFRDFGLTSALVKFIPEWTVKNAAGKIRSAIRWTIKIQAMAAGLFCVVIIVLAPWLADVYFHTPGSAVLLQVMVLSFFVSVFGTTFLASLQGTQNVKKFATSQPLTSIFPLIFTVTLVLLGFGLLGAVVSYLFSAIAFAVVTWIALGSVLPKSRTTVNHGDKRKLIRFALPVLLGSVGGMVLGSIDTIVITLFRPLSDVGLYQAALPTSVVLWSLVGAISIVLFPMISEMWSRNNKAALSNGVSLLLKFSLVLVLPFALIMIAWPEFVLQLLFGPSYVAGAAALQILAVAAIAYTLWQICATTLSGIGRPVLVTKIMLGAAIFNLIANIICVQIFGIAGVAATTLMSFAAAFVIAFIYLKKIVGLRLMAAGIAKTVVAGLVMVGIIFGIKSVLVTNPWIEVVISLIVGLAAYTILVLRLKAVSKNELEMLSGFSIPVPRFLFKLAKAIAG
jgi:O-antigen/teichoic acid export membrane protein